MSKIRIKNFGPIKDGYTENDGWIDIEKVTVFIGNQGSGKSTVAKLISTFSWIEKAIYRGDLDAALSRAEIEEHLKYQRINRYIKKDTQIEYHGDILKITYINKTTPHFERVDNKEALVPQIIYIPAERNFLTSIRNFYDTKGLPNTIQSFAYEYRNAQLKYENQELDLPIENTKFVFNSTNETSELIGSDYKIDITESASGFQSFVPMFLVVKYLTERVINKDMDLSLSQQIRKTNEITEILSNKALTNNEKGDAIVKAGSKYINSFLLNIVEEPELNLFPASQWEMLRSLLEFNNSIDENKLILTTHSPYIINYLSLAVEAASLKKRITDSDLMDKLNDIITLNSTIDARDLVIYEMNEKTGTISKLGNYDGIPVDTNFLNSSLVKANSMFDALLEIEQEL